MARPSTLERAADPVRAFLDSAVEARLEYKRLHRRIEELESRAKKVTAQMTGMPGGGGAGMEQLWAILADEREKEKEAVETEMRVYHEVETFIDSLPVPVHRVVCRLHYLDGLNWVQVQMRMNRDGFCYSERQITRIHGEALKSARRLWRERQDA
jgi:hypothetical protein